MLSQGAALVHGSAIHRIALENITPFQPHKLMQLLQEHARSSVSNTRLLHNAFALIVIIGTR